MKTFLDYLQTGDATQAAALIEKTLNSKVRVAIQEQAGVIAERLYADDDVDQQEQPY